MRGLGDCLSWSLPNKCWLTPSSTSLTAQGSADIASYLLMGQEKGQSFPMKTPELWPTGPFTPLCLLITWVIELPTFVPWFERELLLAATQESYLKEKKRQITCLEPQRRVHRATGNEHVSWENRGSHFRVWPEEEGDVKGPVCTDIQVCSPDWWLNRDECSHMQSEFGYIWEMTG